MTGDNVELSLMQRAGSEMPPYQRLLGDAMRGNNELFGREDTSTRNGALWSRS